MKKLTISDIERMSEDQMRSVGKHYNVANADTLPVDQLESFLKAAIEHPQPVAGKTDSTSKKDDRKRVWFKLMADQNIGGDAPVFAALQGNSIMVHRNTWVPLPVSFLPCFSDAVETVVTTLKDGSTRTNDVPRYNFMVLPLTDINTPPESGEAMAGGF